MLDPLCIIVGECSSVQETQNEASLASDGGRQRGKVDEDGRQESAC